MLEKNTKLKRIWLGWKRRHFSKRFKLNLVQLQLFAISTFTAGVVVGFGVLTNEVIIPRLFAASTPWTQTDWSGGVAAGLVTTTVNTYGSESGIDPTTTSGQFSLNETVGWSSTYSSWSFRQAITITNSDSLQTDYQVRVPITYDSDMQADFDDIRFTNSSGTALDYWLQSKTDSTSAVVWIEVDSLAATSDTDIYMYYGNSGSSSGSNGEATFILFDDFNDGTLDTSKWTEVDQVPSGEIYESGGKLHFVRLSNDTWNKAVYGKTTYSRSDISFEMDYKWANNNPSYDALMMGWHDNTSGTSYSNLVYGYYNSGSGGSSTVSQNIYEDGSSRGGGHSWILNQDYDVRIRMRQSGGAYYDYSTDSGASWTNRYTTSYSVESNLRPGWAFYSGTHQYDNARIRKWVSSEPSTVVGAEENKYPSVGTLTSNIFNAEFPADWGELTYSISGGGISTIKVRTDTNSDMSGATDWASCNGISSGTDLTTTNCVDDIDQYLEYQVILQPSTGSSSVFEDISVSFEASDQIAPDVNATSITLVGISEGDWINEGATISWTAGSDNAGGNGLAGYCIALDEADIGSSNLLDPETTAGSLLNALDDGISNASTCGYIVVGTSVNFSDISGLTLSSGKQYYFSIKAVDLSGNVFSGGAGTFQDLASFKYDDTKPNNPAYFSLPGDFIATKSATFVWPSSGSGIASDDHSGVAGLQYRIGSEGVWYGDTHNGNEDLTDLLVDDGSYSTQQYPDFASIQEESNIIYLRTLDVAENVSYAVLSGALKVNTTAPSSPVGLEVTPTTNTDNSFAFSWLAPDNYTGQVGNITYCYTINTQPSVSTCNYTDGGVTSLTADAYANQPGENTLYLVARDEALNINFDTFAFVTFTANTSAPGIPQNIDVADVSVKSTSSWKLAVSWEEPAAVGAGISSYEVYHSTDGVTYSSESSGAGISHVDTNLTQATHYYKVRACDSANNCGAFTSAVSMYPDGKFLVPAELTSSPVVSSITTKKATITWSTDRASDSKVSFGSSSGSYFDEEPSKSTQETDHSIVLTNLSPGTTYYYKTKWTDEDGNTGVSDEATFQTDPAPSISSVVTSDIGLTSAFVSFTVSGATKATINYGLTSAYGGTSETTTSPVESTYTIKLTGLLDGTDYHYKLTLEDSEGELYEFENHEFTTLPRPKISLVRLQQVRGTSTSTVLVTWNTNTEVSSIVSYYPSSNPALVLDTVDTKLKTKHKSIIKNLLPNTAYTLIVKGRDKVGNEAVSDAQAFTTATDTRPPAISNLKVEGEIEGVGEEASAHLVVSWDTDELSSSQVTFGEGSTGPTNNRTQLDTTLTFNHVVIVPNLAPSKVYHVRVLSADKEKNESESIEAVVITPKSTRSALDLVISNLSKAFGFLGNISGGNQ